MTVPAGNVHDQDDILAVPGGLDVSVKIIAVQPAPGLSAFVKLAVGTAETVTGIAGAVVSVSPKVSHCPKIQNRLHPASAVMRAAGHAARDFPAPETEFCKYCEHDSPDLAKPDDFQHPHSVRSLPRLASVPPAF